MAPEFGLQTARACAFRCGISPLGRRLYATVWVSAVGIGYDDTDTKVHDQTSKTRLPTTYQKMGKEFARCRAWHFFDAKRG